MALLGCNQVAICIRLQMELKIRLVVDNASELALNKVPTGCVIWAKQVRFESEFDLFQKHVGKVGLHLIREMKVAESDKPRPGSSSKNEVSKPVLTKRLLLLLLVLRQRVSLKVVIECCVFQGRRPRTILFDWMDNDRRFREGNDDLCPKKRRRRIDQSY